MERRLREASFRIKSFINFLGCESVFLIRPILYLPLLPVAYIITRKRYLQTIYFAVNIKKERNKNRR